jgi:hypothetical protein
MFVSTTVRQAREQHQALAELVDALDPDDIPASESVLLFAELDRIARTAQAACTLLARRVDDAREWQRRGFRSAADHLAAVTGTTVGDAKRQMQASRQLRNLPTTRRRMLSGELSPQQAAAIADAAAVNPDAERALIDTATSANLYELRDEARRAKAAADPDPEATYRRIHAERRCSRHTDSEGAWNLSARGTADQGAIVNAALDPIIDEIFRASRRRGQRAERDTYAFDALVELARRTSGTSPSPADAGPQSTNPRFLGLLRVDVEALRRGQAEGDELCEITGVGPVPVRVAESLLGEAVLKLVITRGTDVVNVTHLGRRPTAAMRAALAWSSPTCTVEGCSRTFTEIDHRLDWAQTRHTRLDELDHLCTGHHDLKTYGGWALVEGTGKRAMVPPDDPRHPGHAPPADSMRPHAPPESAHPSGAPAACDQTHLFDPSAA